MTWQDAIFTVGGLVFAAALLPSLLGPDKPAWSTSFATGVFLCMFGVAYVSLDLFFAATVNVLEAIMWLALGAQVVIRDRMAKCDC